MPSSIHNSIRPVLLAPVLIAGFAASSPVSAGPFDSLKRLAEKLERKTEEAEEVRQRLDAAKRNAEHVADAVGIKRGAKADVSDERNGEVYVDPNDTLATDEWGDPVEPQEASDPEMLGDDGWPEMEPAQDMKGTPQ